ncbi:IclR family transcriptional regulator [Streptomyces sp. ME19-01-6]|uniref:IclR family transcriptional regulator n=1 Tax=Streptomyces sp. ME19-01-6 TaxID=3028686 RepID=UPI0029AD4D30|nr:IclR family transcriptional regulator C-terminal domain-containing protein [Streptomyces sp. ME19-01-6]MDX3233818.1 IclR family transcriptional regulator C-terminal domain-containing protein [Streptomyces sp. ME19-01-6]
MSAQAAPTLITSVQRALRLLEAVGAHEGGAPAKQLAREVGLPLATTYHLLRTLCHDGYARKLDDGGFVVGDKVDALRAGSRGQALLTRVRPTLTALRDDLSVAAYLTFYEDGEIRVAGIVDSPRAPRVDLWVGFGEAGHATALGKCVLRELDAESRGDYLSRHPLADLTPRTITRRDELLRRLEATPVGAPVLDREEYALGTVCLAVPVYSGETLGSLGVSLRVDPSSRLSRLGASLIASSRMGEIQDRLIPAGKRVTRGLSLGV